jgi:hypothetical protein
MRNLGGHRPPSLGGILCANSDVPDAPQPRILTKYFDPSGFRMFQLVKRPRQNHRKAPHRRLPLLAQ